MSKYKKMSFREIYLEAARRIAEGREHYSCTAIEFVTNNNVSHDAKTFYATIMSPSQHRILKVGDIGGDRDLRVWLLCMMAACCETI